MLISHSYVSLPEGTWHLFPCLLPGDGRDGINGNQSDSPLAKLAPKVQQEEVDEDKASRMVVHVDPCRSM